MAVDDSGPHSSLRLSDSIVDPSCMRGMTLKVSAIEGVVCGRLEEKAKSIDPVGAGGKYSRRGVKSWRLGINALSLHRHDRIALSANQFSR